MSRTVMYFTDSPEYGGAESVLMTLMASIDRQQWRPVLVHEPAPRLAPLLAQAARHAVQVHTLPARAGRDPIGRAIQAAALARLLQRERPAVFHANLAWPLAAKYALLVAAASAPAVVASVHSFDVAVSSRTAFLYRAVTAAVDRYVAVSGFVAERMHMRLNVPVKKLRTVPNGIAFGRFSDRAHNNELRQELTGGQDRPIVLTPARLDPVKGHSVLLEAAAALPDVTFALAGDGPQREPLIAEAKRLGVADRVRFLGYRTDVPDLLATCDVMVLPSLCEGFSLTVMEAMAAATPVITTTAGGLAEMVRHGETGLVVPPGDAVALGEAIRCLLSDAALARRVGEAGRRHAQREFSADTMVAQVQTIYASIV